MLMPPSTPFPQPTCWNVWWLLSILAAVIGVTALILEGLGVFGDLGLVLTGISLIATLLFGLTAATRNAVSTIHLDPSQLQPNFSADVSTLRTDLLAGLGESGTGSDNAAHSVRVHATPRGRRSLFRGIRWPVRVPDGADEHVGRPGRLGS